jgi:hypothetical protein
VSRVSAGLEKIVSFDLIAVIMKNAVAKKIMIVYISTSMVISSLILVLKDKKYLL